MNVDAQTQARSLRSQGEPTSAYVGAHWERGHPCPLPWVLGLALLAASALAQPISWTMASRSAGADERYVGEPISMSLRDADLVETLRTFSRIGGFNLIIQPGVKGSVTVELKGVPWDQALDAILKMSWAWT